MTRRRKPPKRGVMWIAVSGIVIVGAGVGVGAALEGEPSSPDPTRSSSSASSGSSPKLTPSSSPSTSRPSSSSSPTSPSLAATPSRASATPTSPASPSTSTSPVSSGTKSSPTKPSPSTTTRTPATAAPSAPAWTIRSEGQALLNRHRAAVGAPPVANYTGMDAAAQQWVDEMARRNVLAHSSNVPPYKAEIIASGAFDARTAIDAWKASPAHWSIAMDPQFTMVGVSYNNGYWTVLFS